LLNINPEATSAQSSNLHLTAEEALPAPTTKTGRGPLMIPGVSSALSSWSALSGHHLLLLASVAGSGAPVFWRVAVNKPVRVLRRSGYRERATPSRFRRYRGDPI